jgi:hypothetical protein
MLVVAASRQIWARIVLAYGKARLFVCHLRQEPVWGSIQVLTLDCLVAHGRHAPPSSLTGMGWRSLNNKPSQTFLTTPEEEDGND